MRLGASWGLLLLALACEGDEPQPSAPRPAAASKAATEAKPQPEVTPRSEPEPAATPEPEPAPTFDAATVSAIDAKVVAILARGGGACGVLHIVGAIEVEVLDAGDPAPHMVLYVSCPSDIPHRNLLKVGARVHVQLHAKKQSWPKPPAELPEGVPVRYAKKLTPIE